MVTTQKIRWVGIALILLSLISVGISGKANEFDPYALQTGELFQAPVAFTNPMAFIGEDGNVYMTDEAGANAPQPVTGDSQGGPTKGYPFFERKNGYGQLRWSPTTNLLAFMQPTTKSLFVVESGKAPNKVSTLVDSGFPPAFSPDGKEIGYVVQTQAATKPGDMVLQMQAVPAAGGPPRALGTLVGSPWQCGGDSAPPADLVYFAEIGLFRTSPLEFAWLKEGYLHTLSCDGSGLALSDGQKDVWQNPNLYSPALSPDGTQLVAVLADPAKDPTGKTNQLNLVDLATGKLTPLANTPFVSRAVFSNDGKTVLFAAVEQGTDTVKGNPASALGKQLFADKWPASDSENAILIWSVPAAGGTNPSLLYKGDGHRVGFMAAGRTKPTLTFSLINSLTDMIQAINSGEPAANVLPLAPHPELNIIPTDTFGSPLKTLRGGQPLILSVDTFSIIPAQKTIATAPTLVPTLFAPTEVPATLVVPTIAIPTIAPTATPAIVLPVGGQCPGFLPSRLTIGGKGRVLPGRSNNLRVSLPLGAVIGSIPPGGVFDVLEGPVCISNGIAYWKVNYGGNVGYTAEGQAGAYWVEPYFPPAFAVTSVVANVSPANSGTCPSTFNFTATITTNGAGTVTYQWERSDGASSSPQTINFGGAGSQNVSTAWNLGAAGTRWERVRILSPNAATSNQATFTLSCGAPAFAVTSVVASVSPANSGTCPTTFNFTATITTNGAGNVTYQWERADGALSGPQTISFGAAGSQNVTHSWTIATAGTYWERLKITSPSAITSNQATFTLSCGAPAFSATGAAASVAAGGPGTCPKVFNFNGTITTNGAGTVTYRWERSDGASGPTHSLAFGAAGSKPVAPTSWNLSASGTFWERIHVLTPNSRFSNQAAFTQTCP